MLNIIGSLGAGVSNVARSLCGEIPQENEPYLPSTTPSSISQTDTPLGDRICTPLAKRKKYHDQRTTVSPRAVPLIQPIQTDCSSASELSTDISDADTIISIHSSTPSERETDEIVIEVSDTSSEEEKLPPQPEKTEYKIGKNIVQASDLNALTQGRWIGDGVINSALHIFQVQSEASAKQSPSCSTMYSRFIHNTVSKKEDGQRFPRTFDISRLSKNRVFIPFNPDNHWVLFMIDNAQKSICCFDSLPRKKAYPQPKHLQRWLVGFHQHRKNTTRARAFQNYSIKSVPIPRQNNLDDCGAAVIWTAEKLYKGNDSLGKASDPSPYKEYRNVIFRTLMDSVTPQKTQPAPQPRRSKRKRK